MEFKEKLAEIAELLKQLIADGTKQTERHNAVNPEWRMHATLIELEIQHHQAVDVHRIANALEEMARR